MFVLPAVIGERISVNCLFQGKKFTPHIFKLQIVVEIVALLLMVYQCPTKCTCGQNTIREVRKELEQVHGQMRKTLALLEKAIRKSRCQTQIEQHWEAIRDITTDTKCENVKKSIGELESYLEERIKYWFK